MSALPIENTAEFSPRGKPAEKRKVYAREYSVRSARPERVKVRSVVRPDVPRTYADVKLSVVPDVADDLSSVRGAAPVEAACGSSYRMRVGKSYASPRISTNTSFPKKTRDTHAAGIRQSVRVEEMPALIPSRALRSARLRTAGGASVAERISARVPMGTPLSVPARVSVAQKNRVSLPKKSAVSVAAEPLLSHAMKMVAMGGAAIGLMCLMFSFGLSTAFHAGLM